MRQPTSSSTLSILKVTAREYRTIHEIRGAFLSIVSVSAAAESVVSGSNGGDTDMPSEPQQQRVIDHGVRGLAHPVTLLYYTPDVPSTATAAERAMLEAIAAASDRVHLEVLAEQWDAAREERVRIARTPAIVVNGAQDYGIRYYGTPDGYELETFLAIIRAVSEGRSGLSEASRAAARALADPLHLEVLVAPT
jgi:hypothetical protein